MRGITKRENKGGEGGGWLGKVDEKDGLWMDASERGARGEGTRVGRVNWSEAGGPARVVGENKLPSFSTNSKAAQRQSWAISLSPTTLEESGMHVQGIQRQ